MNEKIGDVQNNHISIFPWLIAYFN